MRLKFCKKAWVCLLAAPFFLVSFAGLASCKREEDRPAYHISAEYVPAAGILYGEMTVEAVNLSEEPKEEVQFALYPNAFREDAPCPPLPEAYFSAAYYEGESFGGIDVRELTGAKEWEVSEGGEALTVTLSEPLASGGKARLSMKFEVMLPKMNFRLGIGEHTVNLAHFFPVLAEEPPAFSSVGDPFPAERADYMFSLTAPASYSIICGFEGETTENNGRKTLSVQAENVREIAFVLAEGMTCTEGEADGTPVEYWHFRKDASAELSAAAGSLSYFGKQFGEYAYPKYVVVETDLPLGGSEQTALSFVSSSLRGDDLAAAVVHETAHQWWYAMAGSDEVRSAWLDEGLAEYCTALYLGAAEGRYREHISAAEGRYRAFVSVREQLSDTVDTSMDRPLSAFSGAYEYRSIVYDKSVILFDRLHEVLGDKLISDLRRCFSAAKGGVLAPETLVSSLSSGVDVLGIFTSFREGTCVI
ncbi:MAG TPA: hypothetical protein H9797_02465 [Candidatus Gallimonas gallistercoris]|uniref:Peptidase M1 membrane alanine aminopeptidase domain-containing protein n=1 Tax=Candidatus Gallimonas gallistercoris TaxID=2838602 RepID=A0A9D2H0G8_9FIRM|nr:hypothetical protein [Candidatus Gallimonas gallistercoris]